jgi:hypothetical protein
MKVGDLVTMDYSDYPEKYGDQWGVGVVVEIDEQLFYKVSVHWSKIGLSWEEAEMLVSVHESR